jgi:hypothetical protein
MRHECESRECECEDDGGYLGVGQKGLVHCALTGRGCFGVLCSTNVDNRRSKDCHRGTKKRARDRRTRPGPPLN